MKNTYKLLLSLFVFIPTLALADTPTINSFTISTNYMYSGQPISATWSTSGGLAPILRFNCPDGIRIKYTNGTSYPCNADSTVSDKPSDAGDFIITNISGTSKQVGVKLIAKDSTGSTADNISRLQIVTIAPASETITSATVTPTAISSGNKVIISWTGDSDLSGVNIQMACTNNILATSTQYSDGSIPCDRPIFKNDLSPSGSADISLTNQSNAKINVEFTILPAFVVGYYDGTRAKKVTVESTPAEVKYPTISPFTANQSKFKTGTTVTLKWKIQDSLGANLILKCVDGVSYKLIEASSSGALDCGRLALSNTASSTGEINLEVNSTSNFTENTTATIVPKRLDGNYDMAYSASIDLSVYPKSYVAPLTSPNLTAYNIGSSTTPIGATTTDLSKFTGSKYTFKKYLARGSRGQDVSKLQEIWSTNPNIFPEQSVTGYFGAATEKAVKKFQESFGICKNGEQGYGTVGPKTRSKLNEIQQ